jgi:hypothetical protein
VFKPIADIFLDLGQGLAVRERGDGDFPLLDSNGAADGFGKRGVGTADEYFHVRCQGCLEILKRCSPLQQQRQESNNWQTPIKRICALGKNSPRGHPPRLVKG